METKLKGKRIALIGGAGFIGHNMAIALKKQGADVHTIDGLQVNNLLSYASKMPELENREMYLSIIHERLDLLHKNNIPLHVQDVRDYHALAKIMSEIKPNVIVQLAAVSHAGKSNKDPYSTFDHSLRTLENALDCARGNVEQFIFFSSSMVYGNFKTDAVEETHPLEPMGIYGALKVSGELMVKAYNQVFDLPYTIIRPSALYGPRCVSRRVGQIFIESALKGAKLRVDGDGAERLDFTYIDDLVEGISLVIQKKEAINETFNITCGSSRSIQELLKIMQNEFPEVGVEYVTRDKLMPYRGTLSVEKAKRLLGYQAKNPLEIGFPKYIQWYKKLMEQIRIAERSAQA